MELAKQIVLELPEEEQKFIKIQSDGFSKRTKLAIYIITGVLFVNSANLFIQVLMQTLVTIDLFENKKSCTFEWYTLFCIFWLDILSLIDGLCFLLLFKRIATTQTN